MYKNGCVSKLETCKHINSNEKLHLHWKWNSSLYNLWSELFRWSVWVKKYNFITRRFEEYISKKICTVKYFTFLVAITTILILKFLIMPSTINFILHNKCIHLLCYENWISSCSFTIGAFCSVDKYDKYCMIHTHERINTGSYIRAQ